MNIHKEFEMQTPHKKLKLGQDPVLMGILNITPDSFSDGGNFEQIETAFEHARFLVKNGADIIDVGGESTRPKAKETAMQVELNRVIPVIEKIKQAELNTLISIDSYKALVADQAIQSGADIINDVSGLQREPEIADIAALHNVPVIIMHWDKQRDSDKDIIAEIMRFFEKSLLIAKNAGINDNQIVLDPGFGFAKSLIDNYEIMRRFDELHALGYPFVCGTSNKSMIGNLLNIPIDERLSGTIASNIMAYNKGAHIFRVHDVKENLQALKVAKASLYQPYNRSE